MSCHVYKGVSCHVKYLCSLRGTVSCGQSHSTAVVVGVVVGSLGGVNATGGGVKSSSSLGGDHIDIDNMGNTGGTNASDVSQFDYLDNTVDSEGGLHALPVFVIPVS